MPPVSSFKKRDAFLELYLGNKLEQRTRLLLNQCIEAFPPEEEIQYAIEVGTLVKVRKLLESLSSPGVIKEVTSATIIARSIYENCLSLQYMKMKYKEGVHDNFIETDVQRRKAYINYLRSEKPHIVSNPSLRDSTIEGIVESIKTDGYDEGRVRGKVSPTWMGNVSYADMAEVMGVEAVEIYQLFYGISSTSAHPSWTDIKLHHMKLNKVTKKWSVKNDMEDGRRVRNVSLDIIILTCSIFAEAMGLDDAYALSRKLHTDFHAQLHPLGVMALTH